MTGLSAVALALISLLAQNGFWVARQLDRPEIEAILPVAFAIEISPRIRIGLHRRPELPVAFYSPDTLWSSDPDGTLTARRIGPSVNLYAPDYVSRGGLRSPLELGIDRAQPYFEALIEADLQWRTRNGERGFAAVAKHRAEAVFRAVPEAGRFDAYLDALAAFGSDILTIALQLEKSMRKHAARGSDLCRFVDTDRPTLFLIWRRNFADSQYPGTYRDETGQWRTTFEFLAPEDKAFFVEQVLESRWSGDPARDFCR